MFNPCASNPSTALITPWEEKPHLWETAIVKVVALTWTIHTSFASWGFQAHLLTAGARLCCSFIGTLTMTEEHTWWCTIIPFPKCSDACPVAEWWLSHFLSSLPFTPQFKHQEAFRLHWHHSDVRIWLFVDYNEATAATCLLVVEHSFCWGFSLAWDKGWIAHSGNQSDTSTALWKKILDTVRGFQLPCRSERVWRDRGSWMRTGC